MEETECYEKIKHDIQVCYKIYKNYKCLLDSYVLDFFSKNLWNILPNSWINFLDTFETENLGNLLSNKQFRSTSVLPLSLLALKSLLNRYSLPRDQMNLEEIFIGTNNPLESFSFAHNLEVTSKLNNLFWKNVKLKKRHEIDLLGKVCYYYAKQCNCDYIVDIGSGLGHLSRLLSYGYGFKVCSIEAESKLTKQATYLDLQFEKFISKYQCDVNIRRNSPVHINMKVDSNTTSDDIIRIIKSSFNLLDEDNFNFGIVGLHPCGDLSPILLRLYSNSPKILFLNIVGCCYMKLSTSSFNGSQGFPMSSFCLHRDYDISYMAKEVACHAIENYVEKLNNDLSDELKIHSYRAVLEQLIVSSWPHLKHCPLGNIKYHKGLTFSKYCTKALSKCGIKIDNDVLSSKEVEDSLKQWPQVVKFYVVRLMLAPLIETIILLDRVLYIKENGSTCGLFSVFDPMLSPRNHVLTAIKCNRGFK